MKKTITGRIKAATGGYDGTFVLTTEAADRDGDVIEASAWDLTNFLNNPIALWQHDHKNPVGTWENVRIETNRIVADLKLASTNLARMTKQLIEDGVLKAVSVGFIPRDYENIEDSKGNVTGWNITQAELLEASLVSVGANQEALLIAKNYGLTTDEQSIVFHDVPESKSANPEILTRVEAIIGKSASSSTKKEIPKGNEAKKMTLSERIKAKRDELVKLRDELSKSADAYAEDPSDENRETVEGFAANIEESEKQLGTLETAEKNIMATVLQDPEPQQKAPGIITRVKDYDAGELIFRHAAAHMMAFVKSSSVDQIIKDVYRNDRGLEHLTKAAVDPARTDVPTWAGDLLEEQVLGFLGLLDNNSIFGALRPRGVALMFDQYGNVKIPSRSSSSLLAGDFVGEGAPIPVAALAITSKNVSQRNVKIISTMTREIFDGTSGQIETIIRDAVIEDTTKVMDVRMFDANAATTVRPPGLLDGVTPTASSGNTVDNINTDLKALLTPLMTNDAAKDIVIVMHPLRRLGLTMVTNAVGENVFKAEVNSGVLATYPLETSSNIAADEVHAVNARDFVSAYAGPRFETSTTATLHMEDTAPDALGTAGTPNVVAAPVRSLFQTDSIGLRTILPLTWDMRRTDQVASLSGVGW